MNEKIYILLPAHNRREVTRRLIECLRDQTYQNYHLILIDDGSTDGTEEMVRSEISSLTVIKGNGNWWWAGSLQQGFEWLRENGVNSDALILLINDDVRFFPDYLERAVRVMADKKGVLVLSRFWSSDTGKMSETGVFADMRHLSFTIADSPERINCLTTRGLFVYWGDILSIGDFYPKLLPHYLSDYEYTMRAFRKGFKCETSPDLLIIPDENETGRRSFEDLGLIEFFKCFFSKKSVPNPIYWSTFVLLTSPWPWLVPNVIRVWITALIFILKQLTSCKTYKTGNK
jgi:GT2 family glycosyltransferase